MTETEKKAIKLLRKYDKMRIELRKLEQELNRAVLAFAREEKLGWYDRDKFRARLHTLAEVKARNAKQKEAA